MKTLNILGAGKVGVTIGRLLSRHFQVAGIVNRSPESSKNAADQIGSGTSHGKIEDLSAVDVWMIATNDGSIVECARKIAELNLLRENDLVFHCSGLVSSAEVGAVLPEFARWGSLHPIMTFPAAPNIIGSLRGTYCAVEGKSNAVGELSAIAESIQATPFAIDPDDKLLYHSAFVFVSNYLTSLVEVSTQIHAKCGIPPDKSMRLMEPLMRTTLENIFDGGVTKALTGPISRGDYELVEKQMKKVNEFNTTYGELYRLLGTVAVDIASRQSQPALERLNSLKKILQNS